MPQKWSCNLILTEIAKRHVAGEKLNSDFMQQNCRPLYLAGVAYFGSWKCSIEAAGLNYDDVRKKRDCPVWDQSKIVSTIKVRHQSKQPLNSNHIQTKEPKLYAASVKYFGGWSQAIMAAGIDYASVRKKDQMRSWTKTDIAEEIIRRKEAGESIRGGDVSQENNKLYKAAMRHFGESGWAKARMLAGFDPVEPSSLTIWTKEAVCKEIRRLSDNHIDLSTVSVQKSRHHARLLAGARKVFGSWRKAIMASGLKYRNVKRCRMQNWWTKPRIILCIKLLERRGVRLSHKAIQTSRAGLLNAAIKHFGCWSLAVEAAGISYRTHCRIWSTKAWLRKMSQAEYQEKIEIAKIHSKKKR